MATQPENLMPPMSRDADSVLVLQQILDHATAVVYVKDRDGRYQFANRLFLELFHRSANEVIGRTDAEIFPPEITANLHRNDALVFERNAPVEFEEQVPQEDGMRTYLSLKFPLYNVQGEAYAVCGISTDITERKMAEGALRASEERYHTTFNASVDGIALCTSDGRIVDANPAFCRLQGYTREELLAVESFQFVHPDSQMRCWAFFEAASSGHSLSSQAKAQRKDGTFFDAEVHGVPVQYGNEPHLLLIMRDITKDKLAEQQLADREEQYRVMFNAASDGMALWTIDGKLVDVNQACCNLHGMTREQLLKAPLTEFVPPQTMPKLMQLLATVREGRAYQDEAIATHKNGEVFHLDMRGVPATFQGQRHVLLVLRDITEAKKKEEELRKSEAQLRQAQKMEAIGHLTGGVAHDFNNILTAVMGYVAMAQERVAGKGDEKLDKYLDRALRSGRQARDLIQQMLTFSRGQRGEPRALQLPPLVKESVKLMRSTLPSSIEFDTEFDMALPSVLLDLVQLEQVLMNLCINARDAMQGVGMLHIALKQTTHRDGACTSCHQPLHGNYVELTVRDTGPGIAPEVVERMFEPFFSTKEVGKGSGMGLSTVHGIVHEHGGHIIVESKPGSGATFRVLFKPMSHTEGKSGAEATESSASATEVRQLKGRVLVVDDEPAVGEFMGELLESWGLEVTIKPNGPEAEALFAENPQHFDLVVTDQTMPKMTGTELAQRLLAKRPALPVILYTGYTERLTEEQTRRAGIRALVTKPVDIAAFFGLVRDIL
jgi:PAS domain S-box-containing protein